MNENLESNDEVEKPKNKELAASGISAATATILIWIFGVVPPHLEIPGEVGAAISTVIGVIFGLVLRHQK